MDFLFWIRLKYKYIKIGGELFDRIVKEQGFTEKKAADYME